MPPNTHGASGPSDTPVRSDAVHIHSQTLLTEFPSRLKLRNGSISVPVPDIAAGVAVQAHRLGVADILLRVVLEDQLVIASLELHDATTVKAFPLTEPRNLDGPLIDDLHRNLLMALGTT
jgi:hypothetical protein